MPTILDKGQPLPLELGGCVDLYHDVRELRLSMEREAEAIKARETEIKEHIIKNVSINSPGAIGRRYVGKVNEDPKPAIADWGVFCSWVRKNDRFDCLQKRLSDTAVTETMEQEGRVLPGLQIVHVKSLSVTKR